MNLLFFTKRLKAVCLEQVAHVIGDNFVNSQADTHIFSSALFDELLSGAKEISSVSSRILLRYFRSLIIAQNKAESEVEVYDPVTVADRDAEIAIREFIRERWPEHGIVGEEFSAVNEDASIQWVIDPIDGTAAYIMGYPTWGTLIGVVFEGVPILGVMDQPFTQEQFWSRRQDSCWTQRSGQIHRLKTRDCSSIASAVLSTTHPDLFFRQDDLERFFRLKRAAQMARYGGDCYQYCMLASGQIDIVVEAGLKAHDIAALIPIVERAGGCVTTWSGLEAKRGGNILACGDIRLHDKVLTFLND